MKLKQTLQTFILLAILVIGAGFYPARASANISEVLDIVFPVLGGGLYSDDYDQPRSGGARMHKATDIVGSKMQTLVAAVDGTITFLPTPEPSYGWTLTITDKNGYQFNYVHLNNDTPGTDDGLGGYNNAFAPGIMLGSKVKAGQKVGFMGDSGSSEDTVVHLHFEIESPEGEKINPYFSLKKAPVLYTPVKADPTSTSDPKKPAADKTKNSDKSTDNLDLTNRADIFPYDQFEGGATITSGNIDSDSYNAIITGTAFGGGGRTIIKVYDRDATKRYEWFAYGDVFRGGVDVSAADVDGDGKVEIITAPGPGGGPHVKVSKLDGTVVSEFMAYDAGFHGGVYVSAADVDGDGKVEIITAPGPGGGPHVKVFSIKGELKSEWFAYDGGFYGGVDVTAFPKIGEVPGGIATAPGKTGGPHIKNFDIKGNLLSEFFAYSGDYTGGVRISGGNLVTRNGIMELLVAPAGSLDPVVKVYTDKGEFLKEAKITLEENWSGGFDTTISGQDAYVSTSTGMKTTVKKVQF